jgi:general secretion pathway protein B
MSFILDALKKSESDRQRQNGPALFEVKVTPRRRMLPLWAITIGVLLAVNLVIVAWMLLRHPRAEAAVSVTPPPLVASTAAASAPVQQQPLPAPLVVPPAAGSQPVSPLAVPASAPYPAGPAAAGGAADEPNPEDYAPAQEQPRMKGSHVERGTVEGVQLYQDATAAPGAHIPTLRLDLHVYADHPQDRFVMINMHKLREGDALPDGVRVESITADGAVLSYNGSRFLLTQ